MLWLMHQRTLVCCGYGLVVSYYQHRNVVVYIIVVVLCCIVDDASKELNVLWICFSC